MGSGTPSVARCRPLCRAYAVSGAAGPPRVGRIAFSWA